MNSRQPYVRAVVDYEEMNLPDDRTCGDCVHCRRCCAIYGHIPADEVCIAIQRGEATGAQP